MLSKLTTYVALLFVALLGAAVVFALSEGDGGRAVPEISSVQSGRSVSTADEHSDEGEPAPEFEMETLDGDTFRLADHAGDVVVLNFWATWCAPCRVEIPDLVEMQSELAGDGVRFVGISVDHEDDAIIRSFVENAGINYPVLVDDGSVSEKYGGVYALPTTFVIDREGIIQRRKPGIVSKNSLMPLLRDLVDG